MSDPVILGLAAMGVAAVLGGLAGAMRFSGAITGAMALGLVLVMTAACLSLAGASAPALTMLFAGLGFAAGPLSLAAFSATTPSRRGGLNVAAAALVGLACVAAAAAWPHATAWVVTTAAAAEPLGVDRLAWAVAGVAAIAVVTGAALTPPPSAVSISPPAPPAMEEGGRIAAAAAVLTAAAAALVWSPAPSGAAAGAALGLGAAVHGLLADADAAQRRFPPSFLAAVLALGVLGMAGAVLAAALRGHDPFDAHAFFVVAGGPSLGALAVEGGLALAVASGLALMHLAVLRALDGDAEGAA